MNLAPHNLCSGCSACYAVCPRKAISMRPDEEGFAYPHVDESLCVNCGLCERICPSLHPKAPREPISVYAAKAKDDALRMESSSGGVFSLLARQIISDGGIVYGAAIRGVDLSVCHCSAENEEELSWLQGSKYVQSDVSDAYGNVRAQLEAGRKVLFSGTPCQVAALRNFLARDYENLVCVEVICHAAPSPLAWKKFLEKRAAASAKGRDSARPEAVIDRRISFRRKDCGWKRYSLSLRFADDKEYLRDMHTDTFLRGFLSELYNRPSCHECSVRELRSGADITLGDYWNVHQRFPEMDDDTGTSVVLVDSAKGAALVNRVFPFCDIVESDYTDVRRTNPSVCRSSPPNVKRGKFFRLIHMGADFDTTVDRLLKRPLWRRVGSFAKRVAKKVIGK